MYRQAFCRYQVACYLAKNIACISWFSINLIFFSMILIALICFCPDLSIALNRDHQRMWCLLGYPNMDLTDIIE